MALTRDTMEQTLERLLLEREIEQFLYMEAELLDERRFSDWIELIADDIHYHMPIRRNVKFGEQHRENSDPESEISWFDEGKATLAGRVRQINTGIHWCEEPFSRVRHIISNVQVVDVQDDDRQARMAQVDEVLREIGAADVPQLIVYNKIDIDGRCAN